MRIGYKGWHETYIHDKYGLVGGILSYVVRT